MMISGFQVDSSNCTSLPQHSRRARRQPAQRRQQQQQSTGHREDRCGAAKRRWGTATDQQQEGGDTVACLGRRSPVQREQRSNGAGKPSAELKERLQRTAAPRPRHSQSRSSHSSMPKLLHTLCCCFRAADRKKNDSAGAGECCDARTSPISQVGKGPAGADRSSVVQMAGSLRQRLTTPREQKKDSGARFGAQSSNNNNGTLGLAIGTQSTSAGAAEQHRQQQKQQPPGGHHDQHQHFLLPRGAPQDAKRKCLIVDLDETLVHSSFKPVKNADFVIPVEIDNVVHQVYVLKRPHTDAFLERIGALFECVLFTASLAKYADPVADLLDKRRVFRARLFREACVFYEGNYVKDLERLGRDLRNVVIIDNSPASYAFHPDNAIPVRTWFDDPNDRELLDLLPLLEELAHADNIYAVLGTVPPSQQPRSLTPSEDMLLPPPMAPSSPITQVLPPANGQRAVTTIVTTAGAGRGAPEMRRAITMESVPVQRR